MLERNIEIIADFFALGHHIQRFGESHRFVIAGVRRNSDNSRN